MNQQERDARGSRPRNPTKKKKRKKKAEPETVEPKTQEEGSGFGCLFCAT